MVQDAVVAGVTMLGLLMLAVMLYCISRPMPGDKRRYRRGLGHLNKRPEQFPHSYPRGSGGGIHGKNTRIDG